MIRTHAAVTVRMRWWVAPYVQSLALFAWLTGQEVDREKLADLIARRGVRITVSED